MEINNEESSVTIVQVSSPVNAFGIKILARQTEFSQINWAQTLDNIFLYPSSRGNQNINLWRKDQTKRIFWLLCKVRKLWNWPRGDSDDQLWNTVYWSEVIPTHQQFIHAVPAPILVRHSYREVWGRLLACINHVWYQPACLSLSQTEDANLGYNIII